VVTGYAVTFGGLAYLPFIGGFIVIAGICTRLVSRFGARLPMTIGAVLAPVSPPVTGTRSPAGRLRR